MIENSALIVDKKAVIDNTELLRSNLNPNTKIISVIKANGYGLGLVQVAELCEEMGIDILAVLDVEQARDLREAGIKSPILLLGAVLEDNFKYLIEYDLIQVIINHEYALKMNEYALEHGVKIKTHVKHDTGLNRLGMRDYDEIKSCYFLEGLDVQGIYTHFTASQSYDPDDVAFSHLQIKTFNDVLDHLRSEDIDVGMTHMQNSPSILQFGDLGYDAVRCGMVMFGLFHPSQRQIAYDAGYRSVISFETHICMVRDLHKGDAVGYSRSYRVEETMRVATLSTGYCDGIMRSLSVNGGGVVVNGVLCPILGDIAMSQFMIDVTNVDCKLEDKAIVFGHELQSVYETIDLTGQTINEFISHLRYDLKRIYR